MPATIALLERRTLFRQGLAALLHATSDFTVVGEAASVDEARLLCTREQPEIVLLDACLDRCRDSSMPSLLSTLLVCCPQAPIVVLGRAGDTEEMEMAEEERAGALQAGATAYVCTTVESDEFLRTLRHAIETRTVSASTRAAPRTIATSKHPMTERERAVAALLAQGLCNKEIAQRLGISTQTAKNHISHLLEKLSLADRTQLALFVTSHGFEA